MMTLLFTSSSPLARVIVPVTANVIVSPSFAMASALRSEPGPLSLVLVTMMVVGVAVAVAVEVGLGVGVNVAVVIAVGVGVGLAVAVGVAVGVGVGVGLDVAAQYLPPVFNAPLSLNPPQTIIWLPVHTAVCSYRPEGALAVPVAAQLSVLGSYLAPVFK